MRLLPALVLAAMIGAAPLRAADPAAPAGEQPRASGRAKALVYVIPIRDEIAQPVFYILRRGLKEAIAARADAVVLDMETPGGRGDVMLEIMEALDRFSGEKLTYVNSEAGSAGAIIAAVTDEIYFAPRGVMGAAEVVLGSGADVPEALKRKITSYINAKIRAFTSGGDPRRADVLKAMMSADYELKLDGKVLKPKGELLTITAEEAITLYGEPPRPLLAAGIAQDLDSLLSAKYAGRGYTKVELSVTWSEKLAQLLSVAAPILMGLGLLALFIEFKTPGFGWFGATGILLMLVVFFGHYAAGLSGHEPALLFGLGLLLVGVELLFFPGAILPALAGVTCMLLSLIWAGADLWPNQPIDFTGAIFLQPAIDVGIGLAIAVGLFAVLLKYLPRSWVWDKLVLQTAVGTTAAGAAVVPDERDALVGHPGTAMTGLYPSGEVEVEGRRYQARAELGHIEAGTPVVVTGRSDFVLLVDRKAT